MSGSQGGPVPGQISGLAAPRLYPGHCPSTPKRARPRSWCRLALSELTGLCGRPAQLTAPSPATRAPAADGRAGGGPRVLAGLGAVTHGAALRGSLLLCWLRAGVSGPLWVALPGGSGLLALPQALGQRPTWTPAQGPARLPCWEGEARARGGLRAWCGGHAPPVCLGTSAGSGSDWSVCPFSLCSFCFCTESQAGRALLLAAGTACCFPFTPLPPAAEAPCLAAASSCLLPTVGPGDSC